MDKEFNLNRMTDKDLEFYSQELPNHPFTIKIREATKNTAYIVEDMIYPVMKVVTTRTTDYINKQIKLKLLGIQEEIVFDPDTMENIVFFNPN